MNRSLQNAVYLTLLEKKLTLASAESCTGGLVGKRITELPGVSAVYLGGVIAYANSVKIDLLGVKPETLERYGAVSKETAVEMARGAAERLGADIGVSTTGIAGPGGGTANKPVGLVYIGLCRGNRRRAVKLDFSGGIHKNSRETIRRLAADYVFCEILNCLNSL